MARFYETEASKSEHVSHIFFSDYVFTEHPDYDCLSGNNLEVASANNAAEIEACEALCARNQQCGGFVVWDTKCFLKALHCNTDLLSTPYVHLHLKEKVHG